MNSRHHVAGDNDTPAFVLGRMPAAIRDRVAGENARELFGERLAVPN